MGESQSSRLSTTNTDPAVSPEAARRIRAALLLLLLVLPVAFSLTMARTIVFGDPTEYTFVANILGIAHPPGYAFFTVLGKLFQTIVPVGEIPWRMHLLTMLVACAAALFVFGAVRTAAGPILFAHLDHSGESKSDLYGLAAAVFAALTVGLAVNYWQHAIHTNPHMVSAAFLAANLFLLTRWVAAQGSGRSRRWLFAFAMSTGLGITHHPLTVISFPAYLLFILLVRPRIRREWRTLLGMVLFGLLGLSVWLYFPIRSPMEPAFGPSTMNTLDGFLDHVLARGLSESLPYFGLADQPDRAVVFWTLLRLQYSLTVIFLSVLGFLLLVFDQRLGTGAKVKDAAPQPPVASWKLAALYGLVLASNYAFVMSLRAQDVMAYLLGIFVIVGLLAGFGLYGVLVLARERLQLSPTALALLAAAVFLLGPALQLARNGPLVSLREFTDAVDYVNEVNQRFAGTAEGATLLNDWEHQTPLWYEEFVEKNAPDLADVRAELVSTAQPWLESVFATLPGGPVYLSNYRSEIVSAGFRLRPDGDLYQVIEPGDSSIPAGLTPAPGSDGDAAIVAWDLPEREVEAGDYVPLTLALSSPRGTADFYVPVVQVGELAFPFTTDSHLISPEWQPGEVIVERFDFALPHDLPPGSYPVSAALRSLNTNEDGEPVSLGILAVRAGARPVTNRALLANFRQRVGLVSATAIVNRQRAPAVWDEPLTAAPGDTVRLLLEWISLARAEESYTVFVHLIDAENRPLVTLDYTPLGGSTPTHLWIPRWLPGQRMLDPYRLPLPADLAPGTYYIEVGLYEMTGQRRLHMADPLGNLIGDRLILGPLVVTAAGESN